MSFIQKVGSIFTRLLRGEEPTETTEKFTGSDTFFAETGEGFVPVRELRLSAKNVSAFNVKASFVPTSVSHKVITPFYCPECSTSSRVKLGKALFVKPAGRSMWVSFFDESGDFHEHCDSKIRQTVECEAGHKWDFEVWYVKCHCGWLPPDVQLQNFRN